MTTSRSHSKRKMIKTRILILSDTHSALPAASGDGEGEVFSTPFRHPLPSADVLLHCGDLTMNGSISQHEKALELIESVDAAVKVVIPGNHDLTLDRAYYDAFPNLHTAWDKYSDETLARISDMYDGPTARAKGIRYLEEGRAQVTLHNGASLSVYASPWQPEFFNWAFGYPRDVDRFNPSNDDDDDDDDDDKAEKQKNGGGRPVADPVPDFDPLDGVDVMLTHGPPRGVLDTTDTGEDVGCDHLRRAVARCRPRMHCFGHIHEGWGAVRKRWGTNDGGGGEEEENNIIRPSPYEELTRQAGMFLDATDVAYGAETLFVNASIMNVRYRPVNAPWVVDLLLPAAQQEGDGDANGRA